MIVKDVIKLYTHNLGESGYVWMCVCTACHIWCLSLIGGGTPKVGADLEGVYSM